MRRKAWIPLTLLAVGSTFLLSRSLDPSVAPFASAASTPSPALPLHMTSPREASPAPSTSIAAAEVEATKQRSSRDPLELLDGILEDGSRIPSNLDVASGPEIRRILLAAIEREQRYRPLYISPGIVSRLASGQPVRVIFELGRGWTKVEAASLLAGAGASASFDSLRIFPLLDRGVASVGPSALLHLIENSETRQLEIDQVHRASLLETIPIIRADQSHQQGHDGDGFAVAILDTGIDSTHPMFADRLIEEACFSALNDCPNGQAEMLGPGAAVPCGVAGCGHGTRVAGIAVGNEIGGTLIGAAPHANLIAIQIFSNIGGEPGAYSSDILAGLQHVLGLTAFYSIASANLSLGGTLFTSEASCDLAVASQLNAIALLRGAGVVTVAAAGNEAFTNSMTTPACLSNVLSVGSTSDNDVVSNFSNSASFLSLLAPGESVVTSNNGGGVTTSTGTSMATPHVSGSIATIREAIPSASADEIENALGLSGMPVLDTRNGITTPRIQVQDAIVLLESTMPPSADPGDPPPAGGNGPSGPAATSSSSGGGGGSCGLIGIEPFLVLGLVRFVRLAPRRRRTASPLHL